ncbi:class II aaRS and biotin synthetase [Rozella allomycis CSF55]|uniref:Lysyl-tRNA synthetase n=1 Tax=Rozella allomycis (strain CSF55) TaxID=988480 RepID=A0A075AUE2_ROZAC|nr:Aminoacyl-tRNA synthetase, class II (D/K/N)-like domain-containing protein [Rozella allomycis CSF55]RKP16300.1 class II aaRS and biotin synthetase [Rozella allomycis CSF55]|eukprot:EPZ33921.1 Aminoacyl-tRNA synthetase, class II (D/K/N)-like domain-containing protein [Rozella allomycis CSF55]
MRRFFSSISSNYPHYRPKNKIYKYSELISKYQNIAPGTKATDDNVTVVGRISSIREVSKKLTFIDLIRDGQSLQIVSTANVCQTHELVGKFNRGDIVQAEGYVGKTKTGELSLFIKETQRLSLCTENLTTAHFGIKDPEIRNRKRYVDMIVSPNTFRIFQNRFKMIKIIRDHLNSMDFLEVETPIISSELGGANANPFVTYLSDLNQEAYLRVAPELFLKMLVIGGFDRIYEIGKQFRNEDIGTWHHPEFTSCELYMTYATVDDLIHLTEDLIYKIAEVIVVEKDRDFYKPPFKKISIVPFLEQNIGSNIPLQSADRFELFIKGVEVVNAYQELNDPEEQRARFKHQMMDKMLGDVESCSVNENFVDALQYGLPPTAGWGMGIDRMAMLMSGLNSIKEVLAFPLMKSAKNKDLKVNKQRD